MVEDVKKLKQDVEQLKNQIGEKDEKIKGLERRIDELEQYTRKEDVIITGLDTKYPYAAATRGGLVLKDTLWPEEHQLLNGK